MRVVELAADIYPRAAIERALTEHEGRVLAKDITTDATAQLEVTLRLDACKGGPASAIDDLLTDMLRISVSMHTQPDDCLRKHPST